MSKHYISLIPQNISTPVAKRIAVFDTNGNRDGTIPLGLLANPNLGEKKYSFCAFADSHISGVVGDDSETDFIRAIQFAENTDVDFTCICGDTADGMTEWIFGRYSSLKNQYATKPVRVITGNHETHAGNDEVSDTMVSLLPQYFGDTLYYSFEHNNDIFIMLGEYGWTVNTPFADGELQFLYETLEANRNKRCFVFFHVFNFDENDSGQPFLNFYSHDIFALSEANATQKQVFISLLRHYKNAIWFHGHSHAMFHLQTENEKTIYSEKNGYRSVHIPSLSKPKDVVDGVVTTVVAGSQGYYVEVYDNNIVLRGIDFAADEYSTFGQYCIDTRLVTIEANTFTDSTGTITT